MWELEPGVAVTGSAALAWSPQTALERRGGERRLELGGGMSCCRHPSPPLSGVPGPCGSTGAAGLMEGPAKGDSRGPGGRLLRVL